LGATRDLEEITSREKIDRIVLSLKERRGQTPLRELLHLKFAGVAVEDAHTVSEEIDGRIRLEYLSPSWMILSEGFRKSRLLLAAKRMVDVLFHWCCYWLPCRSWNCGARHLAGVGQSHSFPAGTHRTRRTPVPNPEVSLDEQNAEEHGPKWAADGDHRVTRVGRIIRKLRLDELPQAVNVLRGEMSFVGPRPERAIFCRMLENETPFYALRYSVRPGITGWAQVNISTAQASKRLRRSWNTIFSTSNTFRLPWILRFSLKPRKLYCGSVEQNRDKDRGPLDSRDAS